MVRRSRLRLFSRLFLDPEFSIAYQDRWWSLRQGPFATDTLLARIETTALQLTGNTDPALINNTAAPVRQNPAARHFRKYNTLGSATYGQAPVGQTDRNTYRKEIDYLKTWLSTRLEWMDSQATLRPPALLHNTTGQPLYGGSVSTGQTLRFHNPNPAGTVHYTINGADPRQTGGTTLPASLTANTSRIATTTLPPRRPAMEMAAPRHRPLRHRPHMEGRSLHRH